MFKNYKNKLFCFSPPVMLATFLFEFGAAFYTLWRYKLTPISRLAVVTLLSLGTFQLTEFMTCGGLGLNHVEWARLGYASITLLPALGIHLLVVIAHKKRPFLIGAAYLTCAAFLAFFLFTDGAVSIDTCYANYAVFNTHQASIVPYMMYYYGWLLVGMLLAYRWSIENPKYKKPLMGMAYGYLVFVFPTTFFNIVDPSTTKAIPSIMCGFAVLFAFILVFYVLPHSRAAKRK